MKRLDAFLWRRRALYWLAFRSCAGQHLAWLEIDPGRLSVYDDSSHWPGAVAYRSAPPWPAVCKAPRCLLFRVLL